MCNTENEETNGNNQNPNIEDNVEDVPELQWDEAIIGSRKPYDNDSSSTTNNGEDSQ